MLTTVNNVVTQKEEPGRILLLMVNIRSVTCRSLLFRQLDNVVELIASGIHVSAVVNAHHDSVLAVVSNNAEGVNVYAVCILFVTNVNKGIVNDFRMIKLGELVLTHDLLIKKIIGEGEMLAVDIHSVLGEVKNSGVIKISSVLVVAAASEKKSVFGEIVISLEDYGTNDTAEVRLIYLVTLLSGLFEILGLFVDLKVEIRGLGFLTCTDNDNDNTGNANEQTYESEDLNLAHEKSASDKSEDSDNKSDDGVSRNYRRGKVSEISFNIHFLRDILSEWNST